MSKEDEKALLAIKDFAGFETKSAVVRQMISSGLSFHKERTERIEKIKKEISVFTINPAELFPDIKIKRKYLGR